MSWTNPASHIFATSEVVTASTLNTYVQANLTFLGIGYGASMYQAAAQSIPSGVSTLVHYDTIVEDPNGMCTTGATAKITIPSNAGGVYVINWQAAAGASTNYAYLNYNGAALRYAYGSVPLGSTIELLSPTDTLQVDVNQTAGSAQNTSVGRPYSFLGCHLISPN